MLKGPQALFFGKNSPGGVIAMRTADPSDRAEVVARQSFEAYARELRSELILSGPVTDTLGLRLSGMYSDDDGYFRNKGRAQPGTGAIDPKSRWGITEQYILRGTGVWKPSSDFSARLKVNHAYQDVEGGGSPLGACPYGPGLPTSAEVLNPGVQFINPNDDCTIDRDVYIVDLDAAAFEDIRNGGGTFMKTWQTFGTLITLTVVNANASCAALAGYAVYLWHADANGHYSLYTAPTESYLRGVQVTDANGQVTITTIYPACYDGRWPHMHLGIYTSASAATNGRAAKLTSQLALPSALNSAVYADTTTYPSSASVYSRVSLSSDDVFGDNTSAQIAQMTPAFSGSPTAGYTATATIGVAVYIRLTHPAS